MPPSLGVPPALKREMAGAESAGRSELATEAQEIAAEERIFREKRVIELLEKILEKLYAP
jgi:hypothetical protein